MKSITNTSQELIDSESVAGLPINSCDVFVIDFIQSDSPGLKNTGQRVGARTRRAVINHLCGHFSRLLLTFCAPLNSMARVKMYVAVKPVTHCYSPSKLNR